MTSIQMMSDRVRVVGGQFEDLIPYLRFASVRGYGAALTYGNHEGEPTIISSTGPSGHPAVDIVWGPMSKPSELVEFLLTMIGMANPGSFEATLGDIRQNVDSDVREYLPGS